MPQPSNEWERTYEASVRQADDATWAEPDLAFHKFLIDLRGYLLVAGLVIGVGLRWGFYWIAVGAFFVIGAFMWWRYSHRNRR
ncbi:MAG: hypothetical protein WCC60_18950 [Ilumatobacteraceae bacterium]